MKKDEMEILRALSVKLDEKHMLILTYQYHTEVDEMAPPNPEGKQKKDRSKSAYRMIGRVEKISDIEKRSFALHSDSERMNPWKWPDDPTWDGRILYMNDSTNEGRSNWLRLKLRKAVPWEVGLRLMAGFKKDPKVAKALGKKGTPETVYVKFSQSAVYETEGYSCSDGSVVSLLDRDALISKCGQNLWKGLRMKTSPSDV